jgi:hypothetical protein
MPYCPKCASPLVKRVSPDKHYACRRHGFVRKIQTVQDTVSQINKAPAFVTKPSAPRVKKPVAFPRGEKN